MEGISFTNDVLPLKDKLYRLALRITLDKAEAEDIVQETLVRVWENSRQGFDRKSIKAFSLTVCRNLALDTARRAGHGNVTIDEDIEQLAAGMTDHSDAKERLALVRKLMDSLPEVQRSIMELRDIEGMTYQEIAEVMDISDSQVKVYLFRARNKIRDMVRKIEEYGL